MQEIFRCLAGSNLFGTATVKSDRDFKAVAIPSSKEVLMGAAKYVKESTTGNRDERNGPEDVDITAYSLQSFVHLLVTMDANAIETLFAENLLTGIKLDAVGWLREDRFKVLSANRDRFVGYGKSQAMRYTVRGVRKLALEAVVEQLEKYPSNRPINTTILSELIRVAAIPGASVVPVEMPDGSFLDHLDVFGRKVPMTINAGEALKVYAKPLREAGKRAADAAAAGGPDWKGLYHAQRVVDEGIELFTTGELQFPLTRAPYYLEVRAGEHPLEAVLDRFEGSLAELEALKPISDFPESVDTEWADEFVRSCHEQVVIRDYDKWRAAA